MNNNDNMNVPNTNGNANYNQPIPQPMPNQAVNYNQVNGMNHAPKKNNNLVIIICAIVVLALGVGVYLVATDFFDKEDNVASDEEKKDDEGEKEKETTLVHSFSDYQNYKFSMDIVMTYNGTTITTSSSGTADVKNATDYMVTVVKYGGYSVTSYSYSDYNAGFNYTSTDKKTWEAQPTEGDESIKLDSIIDKINSGSTDVTTLGEGHYSVKVDLETEGTVYDNVYADVYVTNGYITKLSYDLTNLVASEGYTAFTIDFKLSDFNEAGDVVIPSSVTSNSSTSV